MIWCELSEEVLGPAWRDLLKVGKKVPRLPQSGAPHLGQGIGALGAITRVTLPPTSKAGGAPAPPNSWRRGIRGLLERGSIALRDSDAASAPGEIQKGYRGPPPAEFSMATPRAVRAKTTSEMGQDSPTRGQLVPGCTITSELYVILEAHDIDEDEASNDAAEWLNAMGHELEVAGYPKNMTNSAITSGTW